jgi:hypothetical protein
MTTREKAIGLWVNLPADYKSHLCKVNAKILRGERTWTSLTDSEIEMLLNHPVQDINNNEQVIELYQVTWVNGKLIVDWEKISKEYNWIAVSSSGEVEAFENKPDLIPTRNPHFPFEWKDLKRGTWEFIGELDIEIERPEETLQQRPQD